MARARLDIPAERLGGVLSSLARLGAEVSAPVTRGDQVVVEAVLRSAAVHALQGALPGLTGGEGVADTSFCGYRPVRGHVPAR
jgi:ribosomal protection tetracycline resistance protein